MSVKNMPESEMPSSSSQQEVNSIDPRKSPPRDAWAVNSPTDEKKSKEPDQHPAKPQRRKHASHRKPYERHIYYKRPVPHPSDPEPPHGLYLTDPRPFGLLGDFIERYGYHNECYHVPQSCVTRTSDGQRPGYDKPLNSEVALNVLLSKPPRAQHVEQMCEWFDTKRALVMVMENLQPFKTLKEFIRGKESLLTEDMAQVFMIQAVMGEKECLDRGVFHQGLCLDNILFNPKNLKLHITDFSKGTFVDTSDFDMSQYSGKSLPVEYKKRARYIAEVETVWSLGSLLYMMLVGREPYWDEDRKATETLIFKYTAHKAPPTQKEKHSFKQKAKGMMGKREETPNLNERFSLSRECQDLLSRCLNRSEVHRATLQQILEHEWFRIQLEPKPPCPLSQYKALPRSSKFTEQYERGESLEFGRMWSCTRKVDGQEFIMKHSSYSVFDRRVILVDYGTCMDTEVGLNVVMQQMPSSHGVLLMENAFEDTSGHILVFRHPGPCKSLEKFLKRNGGRVSEHMAREFMVQAAMAVKDCIDRGVYHEDITLVNFLVNTETQKLLLHNFSKGQLVDTEYDSSLYRGKALPVELKKRERYLAEASVVSSLGCMLYTMAKQKFEDEERKRAERKARGEDTWMLPEVDNRLQEIGQEHTVKNKKKKKEKKAKKSKKEKKKKIKKEKREQEDGSSDSSQDSEDEWVEGSTQSGGGEKPWKVEQEATPLAQPVLTK
ncbi:Serine/threonine-protein kinase PLK4 [Triplophysa tibetana]|uniref:non-specific serine/threonine protein kinase n=1 Tax=Triplophysa tibetana TaxID=1572043 RepID=A0A5A9MUL3_9TELE|nr:Serine/threonine-protein kinase PLK4 [Triplophysa tibetana]